AVIFVNRKHGKRRDARPRYGVIDIHHRQTIFAHGGGELAQREIIAATVSGFGGVLFVLLPERMLELVVILFERFPRARDAGFAGFAAAFNPNQRRVAVLLRGIGGFRALQLVARHIVRTRRSPVYAHFGDDALLRFQHGDGVVVACPTSGRRVLWML